MTTKKNDIILTFNYAMWSADTTESLAKKKNPKTMENTIRKDIINTLVSGKTSTYYNEKPAYISLPFFANVSFGRLKPRVKVEFDGGKFSSTINPLIGSEFTYNGKIHVTMTYKI